MDTETRVMSLVTRRLAPLLILSYFVSYLDRANIGIASLTMNHDLGLSAQAYAFGAGIFFLGYFLFEIPSNIILHRVGARRWIARIMFSWGLISGAMVFVQGERSFYAVRVLLGLAEAGFFPGVIYYVTLWFPESYRARVLGYFALALTMSGVIGSPVSAALLGLNGAGGLAGWRWLFVLEAIPSVVLAFVVLRYLTERPEVAGWLPDDGRAWLVARLADERRRNSGRAPAPSIWTALTEPRVLLLSLAYFGIGANGYGLSFFLPQIVKEFGLTNLQTGFVSAIPFLVAGLVMVVWSRRSDRSGERRVNAAAALALGGIGMVAAALASDPYLRMVAITAGAAGTYAAIPIFWTLPSARASGAAAAASIALINAIGNLAGFAGPYAIGYFKTQQGNFGIGLAMIGATALLSAVIVLAVMPSARGQPAPAM